MKSEVVEKVNYPWIVVPVGCGYAVARNGKDGTPDVRKYLYLDKRNAEDDAELLNDNEDGENKRCLK